jgi:hypothetical protein
MDALVHGGFIVVLALQLICYAALTRSLALHMSAVAGMIFFTIGTVFMCGSLFLDGLVTPAIAAHYVMKPDKIESARVIFVLLGTMVSFLMPIALMFQSAAVAAWGWALTANGWRVIGTLGLGLGGLFLVALPAAFVMMNPIVLMGAIAAMAIWAVGVGVFLMRAPA